MSINFSVCCAFYNMVTFKLLYLVSDIIPSRNCFGFWEIFILEAFRVMTYSVRISEWWLTRYAFRVITYSVQSICHNEDLPSTGVLCLLRLVIFFSEYLFQDLANASNLVCLERNKTCCQRENGIFLSEDEISVGFGHLDSRASHLSCP